MILVIKANPKAIKKSFTMSHLGLVLEEID